MKSVSRLMEVKLVVPEENVGGIIADLSGRFVGIDVGVIKAVPFTKNKPKGKIKNKKAWTAARLRKFKKTLRKKALARNRTDEE